VRPAAALSREVCASCRELLEHYKIPRTFSIVEQIPRSVTGKTDKRALAGSLS
jgi:acyl-CoA synthetase (AMP-forming)/AMP-acid ligase II